MFFFYLCIIPIHELAVEIILLRTLFIKKIHMLYQKKNNNLYTKSISCNIQGFFLKCKPFRVKWGTWAIANWTHIHLKNLDLEKQSIE